MAMVMVPQSAMATLYVGDLDMSVLEDDLGGLFNKFGLVTIRLCRDRVTQRSLRYAYVNFNVYEEAENALRILNHTPLMGKPMRIMWSNRNPYTRRAGVGNLFVKNLDPSVGPGPLELVFAPYGGVISCKVVYDELSGKSKCFGFVQMSSHEEAQNAIAALNNNSSTGISKQLYVANFLKKNTNGGAAGQERKNNLYIKNLEADVTNELLYDKFSEFGKVISAVVMKDANNKSKEFGFVSFEKLEHAEKALETMNGFEWGKKQLYVSYAQKKAERTALLKKKYATNHESTSKFKGYGIFVRNLESTVDDKALEEHFAGCGNILYRRVLLDSNNKNLSRGCAFVYFSTQEEASSAIQTMDGAQLRNKKIKVMRVLPKDQLKKPLSSTTHTGTKITAPAPGPVMYAPIQAQPQAVQQPYYVTPNNYYPNVPYTNTYNVNVQQPQPQNAWPNYNYNYNGYSYAPYTTPTQPVQAKPVYHGGYDPYSFQYTQPQQLSIVQGGSEWSTNNGKVSKSTSEWNDNMIYTSGGGGAKSAGRNNKNQSKFVSSSNNKQPIGPRKSKGLGVQTN